MKIVHLIPNLDKGGAERICLDICEELANNGHEVKVYIFEDINKYKTVYPNVDVEYVSVAYSLSLLKKNKINIANLQSKIQEFNPDVIHSHLYLANIIGLELKPKKHVIHVHSNLPSLKKMSITSLLNPRKAGVFYEQKRIFTSIKNSDVTFLTIAQESHNYITKNLKKLNAKIVLQHNAINLKRFNSSQPKTKTDRTSIISIARLIDYKGHDLTIDVADQLQKMNFNFEISIFGEGVERNKLQGKIDQKGLANKVNLAGLTDRPESEFSKADLYFHPTKYEPFGLVLIEAMASGTPVITTDGQGNRDVVTDRVNGLFFYDRDPVKIAKSIVEVSSNNTLREKLIKNGLDFSENFGLKNYCKRLIEIYSN